MKKHTDNGPTDTNLMLTPWKYSTKRHWKHFQNSLKIDKNIKQNHKILTFLCIFYIFGFELHTFNKNYIYVPRLIFRIVAPCPCKKVFEQFSYSQKKLKMCISKTLTRFWFQGPDHIQVNCCWIVENCWPNDTDQILSNNLLLV